MIDAVRLIVFVRPPRPGETKTRLARRWGDLTAADLYRTWVPPLIERLKNAVPFALEVAVASASLDDAAEVADWLGLQPGQVTLQIGDGLTPRLTNAFTHAFDQGCTRVLVMGSDSPQILPEEVAANADLLSEHDVVLGPAEDGGYYLVGLRQPPEGLFKRVRWSTCDALEDTRRNAAAMGWSVGVGPVRADIDSPDDLINFLVRYPSPEWNPLRRLLQDAER